MEPVSDARDRNIQQFSYSPATHAVPQAAHVQQSSKGTKNPVQRKPLPGTLPTSSRLPIGSGLTKTTLYPSIQQQYVNRNGGSGSGSGGGSGSGSGGGSGGGGGGGGMGFPPMSRTRSEVSAVSSVSRMSTVSALSAEEQNSGYIQEYLRNNEIQNENTPGGIRSEGGNQSSPLQEDKRSQRLDVAEVYSPYTPYSEYPTPYSPFYGIEAEREKQQLTTPPEESRLERPYWKPVTAKPLFLGLFIACTIILVVVVDVLLRISENNTGLADAAAHHKHDPSGFTFLHAYLPIIIAVLYTQAWWAINTDIQRTEPYARLSRPMGTSGNSSLFLSVKLLTAPITALLQREWIVFCSVIAYIIALLIITPLQGTLFSINYVNHTEPATFDVLQHFDTSNPLSISWETYEGLIRVQTMLSYGRNVSTSGWITKNGFVALPGMLLQEELAGGRVETWEFESQVFKMDLECADYQPSKVYGTLCDANKEEDDERECNGAETNFVAEYTVQIDEKEYNFFVGYNGLFSRDRILEDSPDATGEEVIDWYFGDFGVIYNSAPDWDVYASPVVRMNRNLTNPFRGIPERMILTWNKVTLLQGVEVVNDDNGGWQAMEQPTYELHICKPKYLVASIPVTFTSSFLDSTLVGTGIDDRLYVDEKVFYEHAVEFSVDQGQFNKADFEWHMFGGTGDSNLDNISDSSSISVLTGDMTPGDLPWTITAGGLRLMVNSRNHKIISLQGGFLREARSFTSSMFANFVDVINRNKEVSRGIQVQGKRSLIKRRLFVLKGFARALQGCFIVSILLACGILYSSFRREIRLHQDPDTIVAKLAMLKHGSIPAFNQHDRSSLNVLKAKVGNARFRLSKDGQLQQVDEPSSAPDELLTPSVDSHGHDQSTYPITPWRPFEFRLPWLALFILYVLGILSAVIALWKLSERPGAIGPAGNRYVYGVKWTSVDFLWTTLPILIIQGVKLQWGSLDETLRVFEPFARLLERMAPGRVSVGVSYSSTIVGLVTVKALRRGAYLLGLITFISLLTEFLTVATGALFERELIPVTSYPPLLRSWSVNTSPISGSEVYFDTLSRQTENNYIFSAIYSATRNDSEETPWTSKDWVFAPVDTTDDYVSGNLTFTTTGVRASLDCEGIRIPEGLVKRINFTVNTDLGPYQGRGGNMRNIPAYNWTKESLEENFDQDHAWVITSTDRAKGIPGGKDGRTVYSKGNHGYILPTHPNPYLSSSHRIPLNMVYKQQWQTDFQLANYSWGYWDFFQNESPQGDIDYIPTNMSTIDAIAVFPQTFGVFWAQGEVMGYRLDNVRYAARSTGSKESVREVSMSYSHLYRQKPKITILTCHPRYESSTARVTIDVATERVLEYTLLSDPTPVENAQTFISPPQDSSSGNSSSTTTCKTLQCALQNYTLGFGTAFLPPLLLSSHNKLTITSTNQNSRSKDSQYEQKRSFNTSSSPAAYIAALPYFRTGNGNRLSVPEELARASSFSFGRMFVEFAAVKRDSSHGNGDTNTDALKSKPTKYSGGNWNVQNHVFISTEPTVPNNLIPSDTNNMALGIHTRHYQIVTLVRTPAVIIIFILICMFLGLILALISRRRIVTRLPRAPDTLGSVLGWLYARRGASGEEEEEDGGIGDKYFGMGVFLSGGVGACAAGDADGDTNGEESLKETQSRHLQLHWGIDIEPLVEDDELLVLN